MAGILRLRKAAPASSSSSRRGFIVLSEELREALHSKQPIVALESTIISHGMPFPRNLEVAKSVEQAVRDAGAIPATVAILKGVPKIGLSESDLLHLAKGESILKVSSRDMAYACSAKLSAATTVASTMRLAHASGISIFATGGIGGVHRGGETTFDISADLFELSRTPVTVFCAGIKSILDVPKTLEVLETYGVPVIGFKSKEFPAFFTNDSGVKSPLVLQSEEEVAEMIIRSRLLNMPHGMVVGVPNPHPANSEKITYAINFAISSAATEGIKGAAITPYLLSKVNALTGGDSLDSNVSLVTHNASVAARTAVAYSRMREEAAASDSAPDDASDHSYTFYNSYSSSHASTRTTPTPTSTPTPTPTPVSAFQRGKSSGDPVTPPPLVSSPALSTTTITTNTTTATTTAPSAQVLVVGGAVVDIVGRVTAPVTHMGSSNPGRTHTSYGGVGFNIASTMAHLFSSSNSRDGSSYKVMLATAIADDSVGRDLKQSAERMGIDMSLARVVKTATNATASTATYTALYDSSGDLRLAVADMEVFGLVDAQYVNSLASVIKQCAIVATDGNLSPSAFEMLANTCARLSVPLFFEPTSDHKCLVPFLTDSFSKLSIVKPNISELIQMAKFCLQNDKVISGRAQLQATLSNLSTNPGLGLGLVDDVEEVDIRILARSVYQQLLGAEEDTFENSSVAAAGGGSSGAGSKSIVKGKHMLVSMGPRGVLWCGPRSVILGAENNSNSASNRANSSSLLENISVENNGSVMARLSTIKIDPTTIKIVSTNGAGDAFCGGLLADIIMNGGGGGGGGGEFPKESSLRNGLMVAHHRIINGSLQEFEK